MQVTSGHRVTITYNLYFDARKGVPITHSPPDTKNAPQQPEHPFKVALRACLDNVTEQPIQRYLGFGLAHAYPFKTALLDTRMLNPKGADAELIKTLSEFNIKYDFYLLYRESNNCDQHCPFQVLSKAVIDTFDGFMEDEQRVFDVITDKGFLVWDHNYPVPWCSEWYKSYERHQEMYESMDVEWMTEPNEEYLDRTAFVAYGNQASLGYSYHQLCVVATIDPTSIKLESV